MSLLSFTVPQHSLFDPLDYDLSLIDSFPRQLAHNLLSSGGDRAIQSDERKFKVNLDCHHFKPEELSIKLQDNKVTIHGKHEEKQDQHGYIKREFTRTYVLPDNCDLDALKSNISKQGVLTLECPRNVTPLENNVRNIPIERSNNTKSIK